MPDLSDLPLIDQLLARFGDGQERSAHALCQELGRRGREDRQAVHSSIYSLRLQGRLTARSGADGKRHYRLAVDPLANLGADATPEPAAKIGAEAPPTPPETSAPARVAASAAKIGAEAPPTHAETSVGAALAARSPKISSPRAGRSRSAPRRRTEAPPQSAPISTREARLHLLGSLLGQVQALMLFVRQGYLEAAEALLASQIDTLSALYLVERKDPT